MKKNVAFITSVYPYSGGEQFIENEIPLWARRINANIELTIYPMSTNRLVRPVPSEVEVDDSLANILKNKPDFTYKYIFSMLFWKELACLIKSSKFTFSKMSKALRMISKVKQAEKALVDICREKKISIIYCYWNNYIAYAAAILKKKGVVTKVYSRLHNWDLYEERQKYAYMPLKRLFLNEYDKLFVLSNSAATYIYETYGVKEKIISVSRLGVDCEHKETIGTSHNTLHIISLSYCARVKRIDKIIAALKIFSNNNPHISINWSHIGDGSERASLEALAKTSLISSNIVFQFKGEIPNQEVQRFLSENNVDILLNASESEGVPVSIMEAMSYGVSVVAPDVGGIRELLETRSCRLLSSSPSPKEISLALEELFLLSKKPETRALSQKKICELYNRDINYTDFISEILGCG
ncbi:MAG: glycosyltransferase involved in cell wall biosynthesis [Oleiphilaceae bacterium]|jgi:glycosyltransferase involved in cell wall biosynthesis